MTSSPNHIQARITALFACTVLLAAATQASASSSASIPRPGDAYGFQAGLEAPPARAGYVTVTIRLKSNSFLAELPAKAERLLKSTQGSAAARAAARRSPTRRSAAETVAASIAENSRNAALPYVKAAAATDAKVSDRFQRYLTKHGGVVISASPIPNQVTASVPRELLPSLRANPVVARVSGSKLPQLMGSGIDGSQTWWANGFTGHGTSADGNGSPDAVVFDLGARTTHLAFRSRLPGDCSTCDGSGPTRIVSPTVRLDFSGSKHGNTIAAMLGATPLSTTPYVGMAYGMDKLYDDYEAYNPYRWNIGVDTPRPSSYPTSYPANDPGLGGSTDLPEVINYSAGIYQDNVDWDPNWVYFDALEDRLNILNTVSAGNCGIATPSFTNCADGPHRVSTPTTQYNVVSVGGLQSSTAYPDTSGYAPWPNSSPGPTYGGRKKPDVIAPVFGTSGTPSAIDDNAWTSAGGDGTSFAAPVAAGGALLLASAGVYAPTAQKAIMVNSTTPVQGQTYWTPRTGWGALNMSTAFTQRGNYSSGSVSGAGANSARFFQITGVNPGDRSTLVWNRRTAGTNIYDPSYYDLTNLDLSQLDPGTLASTATGGSDASDTVDTDQTVTANNPMPGNGSDGGDNVEQVRSTASGTQILKVKALSAVDGASTEPFSIASARPITELAPPLPSIALGTSPSLPGLNQNVTVTATVTNPSGDLALSAASAQLNLPSGVVLVSGSNPQVLGPITANGTAVASWSVQATSIGEKALSVTTSGSAYGETFSGSTSAEVTPDGTPPSIQFMPIPAQSQTIAPTFGWSVSDSQSSVTGVDVEQSVAGGAWMRVLSGATVNSLTVAAADGQSIAVRVRATDALGNTSDWSTAKTTIVLVPSATQDGRSPSALRLATPRVRAGRVTFSGVLARSATGKVKATVRRTGRFGTRKVTKTLRIRNARFAGSFHLRRGNYRLTVSYKGTSALRQASSRRHFTVR